jgi:hypothetical protein
LSEDTEGAFSGGGDDPVSEEPQFVHPIGTPIRHSTHRGFSLPEDGGLKRTAPGSPVLGSLASKLPRFSGSLVLGVGHAFTCPGNINRGFEWFP